MRVWDTVRGVLVKTMVGAAPSLLLMAGSAPVAFSPDGRTLAAGSAPDAVILWDTARWTERGRVDAPERPLCIAFSPNGRLLVGGNVHSAVALWDARGRIVRRLMGRVHAVQTLALDATGRTLAVGHDDGTIALWDNDAGRVARTLTGGADGIRALAFAPSGRTLAAGDQGGMLTLWDPATGRAVAAVRGDSNVLLTLAFSPDGKTLAGGGTDGTVKLWDAATGALLAALPGHTDYVLAVAFSPDGQTLASAGIDKTVRLWDVASRRVVQVLTGHEDAVNTLAFRPDGRALASADASGVVNLWDPSDGRWMSSWASSWEGSGAGIKALAFSPEGQTLAVGSEDGGLILRNAATGVGRALLASSGSVTALAFSPNSGLLVSGNEDGSARWWDAAQGRELCRCIALGPDDWVVVSPEGRFDTDNLETGEGASLGLAGCPVHAHPPGSLHAAVLHPAPAAAPSRRRAAAADSEHRHAEPRPAARHNHESPAAPRRRPRAGRCHRHDQQSVGRLSSEWSHRHENHDAYDLRVFRDGQLVGSLPGDLTSKGGKRTHTFTVRLPRDGADHAEFSAYAFNVDRVKSRTDRRTYTLPQPLPIVKGRAYVISLGVNAYEDPAWDLRYCVNDARRLQGALVPDLAKTGQFRRVISVPLISDAHTHTATKAALRAVLARLAGEPADAQALISVPDAAWLQKALPEDLVLLTFSCHGIANSSGGDFYLLPSDIGPRFDGKLTADLQARAVSSAELSQWLRDVDAGQIALIVDACHSAAGVEAGNFKPGPMGSRGLGQLAYDKGLRILAASQADNFALESDALRDGLLTYALVHDGLTCGQADAAPKDGAITLVKWLRYGVARVPALAAEVRAGHIQDFGRGDRAGRAVVDDDATTSRKPQPIQQPLLFDFNRHQKDILLVPAVVLDAPPPTSVLTAPAPHVIIAP